MYSNSCCSIKISQSSHKMYSNNILNFQESTTNLNACRKKSLETTYIVCVIVIYIYIITIFCMHIYIYIYIVYIYIYTYRERDSVSVLL